MHHYEVWVIFNKVLYIFAIAIGALAATLRSTNKLFTSLNNVRRYNNVL